MKTIYLNYYKLKRKQIKNAVTLRTCYNGFFNVTNSNNKFHLIKSNSDEDGFIQITIQHGAYEIGMLNKEIKSIFLDKEHYTEANYPFTIKQNFSALGSFIEISTQGPVITFVPDDSIRDLLGFSKTTIYEENNLSPNPVGILSFDNIFLEADVARGMIFRGKRSELLHIFTMNVDPAAKCIEKFRGSVQLFMKESKDII